jgi:hypothetical protein
MLAEKKIRENQFTQCIPQSSLSGAVLKVDCPQLTSSSNHHGDWANNRFGRSSGDFPMNHSAKK